MTYQETIHRYLSGEATPDEEASLFTGLADHPEWRDELQFQMELERATQSDLGKLHVPNAVTSSIFSELGFSNRVAASGALLSLFRTYRTAIVVLAGFVGIATLMYFLEQPDPVQKPVPISSIVPQRIEVAQDQRQSPVTQTVSGAWQKRRSRLADKHTTASAPVVPNEPMTVHLDIAEFSSVAYLTPQKIIGVASAGRIYASNDAGKSWILQKSGTTSDLFGVSFLDTADGIAVGSNGLILTTNSGGASWNRVKSNTTANLNTVRFATTDTVYVCGDNGVIMRSVNGGSLWAIQSSPTSANLFRILFQNGSNGEVRGEHGIRFITHNGGEIWEAAQ
jgi:hypothetical protein